jgi:hypothetical protein
MPYIFDLLYREYCRARLAEMRKQLLLVSPTIHSEPEPIWDAKDAVGASSDKADGNGRGLAATEPTLNETAGRVTEALSRSER